MTDRQREPRKPGRSPQEKPRLFQRPGYKNWWFYYRGECLSARSPDRAEAKRYADAHVAKKAAQRSGAATGGDATAGDAIDFYVAWLTGNRSEKAPMVSQHARVLRPYFGPLRIAELDAARVGLAFAAERQAKVGLKGAMDGTIRAYVSTLNKALRAFRDAHPAMRLPEVRVRGPKKGRARELWLTRGEVARMLWAARGRIWDPKAGDWRRHPPTVPYRLGRPKLRSADWRARMRPVARLIVLGVYTGSRSDVLLNVGWRRDPEHGHVEFVGDRAIIIRAGWAREETSKGRAETALPRQARVLARLWRRNDDLPHDPFTLEPRRPVEAIVHLGGRRASTAFQTRWIKVARAAGFNLTRPGARPVRGDPGPSPWISPHVLRHSCATWAVQGGASVEEAAAHIDVTTEVFEATYLQVSPDFAAEAALALDPSWFRRSKVLRMPDGSTRRMLPPEGKPSRDG